MIAFLLYYVWDSVLVQVGRNCLLPLITHILVGIS